LSLTASQESDAMIEGLDHIASVLRLYDIRTTLRHNTAADEYRTTVIALYSYILEYQARMACHLSDNSMIRGVHSIIGSGQWVNFLKKIDSADQYCQKHEALIDKDEERSALERQTKQIETSTLIQAEILDAVRNVLSARAADREYDRQEDVLQCLAADYEEQKNFNPERVPDTCRWFLDDHRFHKWRNSTTSCVLWLSTGPGCGKSVLSRTLVDENLLTSRIMTSTVCYFFFKDGLERRQRGEDALCAILHQLYRQNLASGLISHAYEPFKSNGQNLRSMFSELWKVLMKTAQDQSAGEIICLLDALDECQADAREQFLGQLNQLYNDFKPNVPNQPHIKFLITSRPNSDIDAKFCLLDPLTNFIEFAGDDQSDLISKEISLVIDRRIPEVVPKLDAKSQTRLAEDLKSMGHRTYLWLHLVLKEIQRKFSSYSTLKRIKNLVQQLPASVADAYENILNRSSDPQVARDILMIVLAARRPLTVHEMSVAVAIQRSKRPKSYEDLDLEPEDIRESNLRDICGFFISIHQSKISLIHQTAREFLLRAASQNGIESTASVPCMKWRHSVSIAEAEYVTSQICITLLLFDVFNEKMPWSDFHGPHYDWKDEYEHFISDYPLLKYASTRWPEHYLVSQRLNTEEEVGLARLVCDVQHAYCETWFPLFWYSEEWRERPTVTTLAIASTFGFTTIVKQILDLSANTYHDETDICGVVMLGEVINESVEYYGTALQAASERGHLDVVKLLLDNGADVNTQGGGRYGSALQAASEEGRLDMVKLLLDKGADVTTQGGDYGNALQAASVSGHSDVVKLLLDKGADVNTQGGDYGNALQVASVSGHSDVVKLLLDKGADVNTQGGSYGNALGTASACGHLDVVKLLLDKGADVNAQGGHYGNALLAASAYGHSDVVKLLLDKGADVNTQGGLYGNALQAASEEGYSDVVKLLLDKGANLNTNTQGGSYGNALGTASACGHLDVVKLLLDKGADVNAQGGHNGNAHRRPPRMATRTW
jgi:ankyrin repeat protein